MATLQISTIVIPSKLGWYFNTRWLICRLPIPYTLYCLPCSAFLWFHHQFLPWWRHQIKTFSALLALCAINSAVTGEFPSQMPVTRSFDFFSLMCAWINGWVNNREAGEFETPSRSLWRHGDVELCDLFTHILQSASLVLGHWGLSSPRCQWNNPERHGLLTTLHPFMWMQLLIHVSKIYNTLHVNCCKGPHLKNNKSLCTA